MRITKTTAVRLPVANYPYIFYLLIFTSKNVID